MRYDVVHNGLTRKVVRKDAEKCVDLIAAIARTINDDVAARYS
jgi:hypothetical protein